MKKTILTGLALLFMAAPVVTAVDASAQGLRDARQELRQDKRENRQDMRQDRRDDRREIRQDRRDVRQERRQDVRPVWLKRGGTYRNGGVQISDYRRYGLHAPGRGQRWVRYDDRYILVSFASGLIASMIVAR